MSRSKSIINKYIAKRSHLLGQIHIVLFFLWMETGIFQHDDFTRFDRFCHCFNFRPNTIRRHLDRDTQQPGQHVRCSFQTELSIKPALGTAKVTHQQHRCSLFEHILDCWKSSLDPFVVCYFPIRHRDVEIHPHQHTLAFQINITYCLLIHFHPPGQISIVS